ncbi:hypothetical protein JCM10207_004492 [Rhodosporidiobolus poonsookiae]
MLDPPPNPPQRHVIFLRTSTCPPSRCPYALAALSRSLAPHSLPILTTTLTHQHQLARAICTLEQEYSGVVVTSARSVDAWAAAAASLSPPSPPSSPTRTRTRTRIPFFVVGHGTRTALLERLDPPHRPIEEDVLGAEESGTGEALARFILDRFEADAQPGTADAGREGGAPKRLLYLTGDKNRDVLPSLLSSSSTITLTPLQVYATAPVPTFPSDLAALLSALSTAPDRPAEEVWLALFSPSSAVALLSALRDDGAKPPPGLRIRFAAIGPTTRDFLVGEGVEVHAVARTPDAEGLVKAIAEAVEREREGEERRQGKGEGRL